LLRIGYAARFWARLRRRLGRGQPGCGLRRGGGLRRRLCGVVRRGCGTGAVDGLPCCRV